MTKRVFLLQALLFFFVANQAQQIEMPELMLKYKKEHVREFCWNNKDERSQATEIPEEWQDESAVILWTQSYWEVKARNSKVYYLSYIQHQRVKILDQAALENYSELYYSKYVHGNYYMYSRQKNFLGVKIIKPDGKEKIIDEDQFIEEDGKKKLAVPGLEIGDIIDYYVYTYDYIPNLITYTIIQRHLIADEYPIVHYNYTVKSDRHWEIFFTTGKNGPEIKEKKYDPKGKFYILEIDEEKIDKIPTELWNYSYRTSPYLKLYAKHSTNNLKNRYNNSEKLRTESLEESKVINHYEYYYEKSRSAINEYFEFNEYLRKNNKKNLPKDKKLEEYFYYMRHHFINMHYVYDNYHKSNTAYREKYYSKYGQETLYRNISDKLFTGHIIYGLQKLDIPYELIVCSKRNMAPLDEVIHINETNYIIKANLKEAIYFYNPTPWTTYNSFPSSIEGTEGYIIKDPAGGGNDLDIEKESLRLSNAEDNQTISYCEITFPDGLSEKILAKTKITMTGYPMMYEKMPLTDWVEMIWKENEKYGTKKWGDLSRAEGNFKVQMEEFKSDLDEERKENFTSFAKGHFDIEELEIIDYKTENIGNQPGESDFRFSFDAEIEGQVKKVGNNYILKIGQLIGDQITLDEEDLEREIDVYMDYARTFRYTTKIEIPEGYEIKGLENLNINIDNKTGHLISTAELEGNTIVWNFSKQYKHNYEKAEDWPLMKEFLVPASLFVTKEIVLKKK